jgi:hypothetical protein
VGVRAEPRSAAAAAACVVAGSLGAYSALAFSSTSPPLSVASVTAEVSAFHLTEVLKPAEINYIPASTPLVFKVSLHNVGDSTETHITVSMILPAGWNPLTPPPGRPQAIEKTISAIGPNDTVTFAFAHTEARTAFRRVGALGLPAQTKITIDVAGRAKSYPIVVEVPSNVVPLSCAQRPTQPIATCSSAASNS